MSAGASVDVQDNNGNTALNLTCGSKVWTPGGIQGLVKTAKLLLDAGANINLTNNFGKCAWDVATKTEIREALSKKD